MRIPTPGIQGSVRAFSMGAWRLGYCADCMKPRSVRQTLDKRWCCIWCHPVIGLIATSTQERDEQ